MKNTGQSRKNQVSQLPFPPEGSELLKNPASLGNWRPTEWYMLDYIICRHKYHASFHESLNTMSRKLGWCKRTVQRFLAKCRNSGLLDWVNRPYKSNVYILSRWFADLRVRAIVGRFLPSLRGLAIAFLMAPHIFITVSQSAHNSARSDKMSTYRFLPVSFKDLSSTRGFVDASGLVKRFINNPQKTGEEKKMSDNPFSDIYYKPKTPQRAPPAPVVRRPSTPSPKVPPPIKPYKPPYKDDFEQWKIEKHIE